MAFLRQCLQEVRTRQHLPGVVEAAAPVPRQRMAVWPAGPRAGDAGSRAYAGLQESKAMRAPEPGGVQV
jgi:hypothetical protein